MPGWAVAPATEADNLHSGRLRRPDTMNAVFDDEAVSRGSVESLGGKNEQIRGRFGAFDHGRAEHVRLEKRQQPGDLKRMTDAIRVTVRGDANRHCQRSEQFGYAFDGS